MRYTYRIPASETVSFQAELGRDLGKRIVPWWVRESNPILQLVAMSAVSGLIAGDWWKGAGIGLAIWYLLLLWQHLYARLFRWFMARRLHSGEQGETWICEIEEDRITHENRGMRVSFPFSALVGVWSDGDRLVLDFGVLGRSRIVPSAIEDAFERAEVIERIKAMVKKAEPGATDNPEGAQRLREDH